MQKTLSIFFPEEIWCWGNENFSWKQNSGETFWNIFAISAPTRSAEEWKLKHQSKSQPWVTVRVCKFEFYSSYSQTALLYTTDSIARIFSYHLMSRRWKFGIRLSRYSNSLQARRVAPDWGISDALPTELQRRGCQQNWWLTRNSKTFGSFWDLKSRALEKLHYRLLFCLRSYLILSLLIYVWQRL